MRRGRGGGLCLIVHGRHKIGGWRSLSIEGGEGGGWAAVEPAASSATTFCWTGVRTQRSAGPAYGEIDIFRDIPLIRLYPGSFGLLAGMGFDLLILNEMGVKISLKFV